MYSLKQLAQSIYLFNFSIIHSCYYLLGNLYSLYNSIPLSTTKFTIPFSSWEKSILTPYTYWSRLKCYYAVYSTLYIPRYSSSINMQDMIFPNFSVQHCILRKYIMTAIHSFTLQLRYIKLSYYAIRQSHGSAWWAKMK